MHPQTLSTQFQIAAFVLGRNLAGISDAAALVAPPGGGNCLNWVVGSVPIGCWWFGLAGAGGQSSLTASRAKIRMRSTVFA